MAIHTYKDKLNQIRSRVHNARRDGMGQKQEPKCACARRGHMTGGDSVGGTLFIFWGFCPFNVAEAERR